MSILIADSGATKTEWCLVKSKDDTRIIPTEGLNPYYHTTESIYNVVSQELTPKIDLAEVRQVYFYGAGCDSEVKSREVYDALIRAIPDAEINVYHDLLAAARACFFDEPGIACILGTGCNSCLYDGEEIVEHIPSLAFILGDEGSAGYFGKKLINMYFRFELPDDLKEALEKDYNMSLDHITRGVYDNPQQSRFVASYASFLGEHADHPFVKKILYDGFHNFITRIVMNYTDARKYEVRFIGSVGYAHQEIISQILADNDMKAGLFLRKPMQRLVEFHTEIKA